MPTKKEETQTSSKETTKETKKTATKTKASSKKTEKASTTKSSDGAKKTPSKETKAAKKSSESSTAKKADEAKKVSTKSSKTKTKSSTKKSTKSNSAKAKETKIKKPEALYYGTGRRKNAVARVRLYAGSGKATINGRDINEYFTREVLINDALSPLSITETNNHFDVVADIKGGGNSGQAGALRHGISRALLEAGDYHTVLKKAGYLTRDSRMVERKKYGLKKARKKSQFSKR